MKELEVKVERCFDVKREVEKIAINHRVDARKLTFDVVGVHTVIKEGDQGERQLSLEKAMEFFSSGEYQKEDYGILQGFDIIVRRISKEDELLDFKLELVRGNSELILSCNNKVYERFEHMLEWVYKKINTQKSLLGVIFEDPSLSYSVADFKAMLGKLDGAISERKKICIAKSRVYEPFLDEYFEFSAKENWEAKNNKVLESSFYALKEGMEAGKKYKAQKGVDGRDLLGEFVKVPFRDPEVMSFALTESDFQITDKEKYISYAVAKDGFVGMGASGLILVKDFNFGEVNSRNFGHLLGGIECGFEISARCESIDKDAVGAGVVIEAKSINIFGNLGQGVILKSQECRVKGSVHQSAEVYASEATLSNHRGKFVGKNVVIGNCEGGSVVCESAEISELVGGEICGREIKVEKMHTNSKIRISKLLEIEEIFGGGNLISIDSSGYWKNKEKIEKIMGHYEKYKRRIDFLDKIYRQELTRAKKIKPMIEQFRSILIQNTQRGIQTQVYVLETIKDYFKLSAKIKAIRSKINALQEEASLVYADLEPIADLTLDARVICKTPWKKNNQIEYINLAREIKEFLEIEDGERIAIVIDPTKYTMIKERL